MNSRRDVLKLCEEFQLLPISQDNLMHNPMGNITEDVDNMFYTGVKSLEQMMQTFA